jgi:hypothetical protein
LKFLRKFADSKNPKSISNKWRRKRFKIFEKLIEDLPKPAKILDVGGTENFWIQMGFADNKKAQIVLLNTEEIITKTPGIAFLKGNAKDLSRFTDKECDVVFSNSVIEHVGGLEEQKKMAAEVQRVGKKFFLQTPSYYFPIEPHFLFPFFQFLPKSLKKFLVMNFNMGWFDKCKTKQEAEALVDSIHLLKKSDLISLFPDGKLYKEKVAGFTKSYIITNS